ncbi:MAG: hypothetical protein AAFZ63_25640 [Bacteroidota bacterium]
MIQNIHTVTVYMNADGTVEDVVVNEGGAVRATDVVLALIKAKLKVEQSIKKQEAKASIK